MAGVIALFCFSLLFFCSHALVSPGSSNATTDELALLSFKSMLSSPSAGLLASWNTSSHYCSWLGVACGRRHLERVVSLRMGSFNLSGRISPFLGNLSFLKELDLGNNQLTGEIPPELGHLGRLQVLNLSTNNLQGSIPVAMGGCAKLRTIDLRSIVLSLAHLSGCQLLQNLYLQKNFLNGSIPAVLSQLRGLQALDLSSNNLSGQIPKFLGEA